MNNLILMPVIIGIMIFAGLAALAFWIWSIIDCIQSKSSSEHKILWLIIIIFLNVLGSLLYFIFSSDNKEFKFESKKGKRLMRSEEDSVIFGVCGGVAKYFDIDSAIVRILWVLLTLFVLNFTGVVIYIVFAIAMPLDKDVKKNKEVKHKKNKTKSADNKKEVSIKNKKNKSPLVILLIVLLSIFVMVSVVFSAFIAFGFVSYNKQGFSFEDISAEIKGSHLTEKDIANQITQSYNYKEYEGYDLRLLGINQLPKERCALFQRDPYGLRIYDSGCKEYHHVFYVKDSDIIKGFEVKNLVIRNDIVETEIIEIHKEKSEDNKQELEFNECLPEQRNVDFCMALYEPVCGYFGNPLDIGVSHETFSNSCEACKNNEVKYWIDGEC